MIGKIIEVLKVYGDIAEDKKNPLEFELKNMDSNRSQKAYDALIEIFQNSALEDFIVSKSGQSIKFKIPDAYNSIKGFGGDYRENQKKLVEQVIVKCDEILQIREHNRKELVERMETANTIEDFIRILENHPSDVIFSKKPDSDKYIVKSKKYQIKYLKQIKDLSEKPIDKLELKALMEELSEAGGLKNKVVQIIDHITKVQNLQKEYEKKHGVKPEVLEIKKLNKQNQFVPQTWDEEHQVEYVEQPKSQEEQYHIKQKVTTKSISSDSIQTIISKNAEDEVEILTGIESGTTPDPEVQQLTQVEEPQYTATQTEKSQAFEQTEPVNVGTVKVEERKRSKFEFKNAEEVQELHGELHAEVEHVIPVQKVEQYHVTPQRGILKEDTKHTFEKKEGEVPDVAIEQRAHVTQTGTLKESTLHPLKQEGLIPAIAHAMHTVNVKQVDKSTIGKIEKIKMEVEELRGVEVHPGPATQNLSAQKPTMEKVPKV